MVNASAASALSGHLNRMKGSLKARPMVTLRTHISKIEMYDRKMKRKVERSKRQSLIRQATYCKTVARRMLKPAKFKRNSPGNPPRLRNGSKLFRYSVHWGWNNKRKYAVVGPVQVTNRDVTEALEKGGKSTAVRRLRYGSSRRAAKKIGKKQATYKSEGRRRQGRRKLAFKDGPRGRTVKRRQKVRAYPFMVPAQKITLNKFANQFKGTFK